MAYQAAGVWALQQPPKITNGVYKLREITPKQLALPMIDGLVIRIHCVDVYDKVKKAYTNWKWLDDQVQKARDAKVKYGILLMGEDESKPWLNPFADKYNHVTNAIGSRYRDCSAWFPGGSIAPNGSSEEPHWNNPMPKECVLVFEKQVDIAVVSFVPACSMLWPVSAKDKSGRIKQCAAYLATKAAGRAMIGHNALKLKDVPPQTPMQWLTAPQNVLASNLAHQYSMGMEFEMVSPTIENHPSKPGFPRPGTRDINECIGQAYRVAGQAGVMAKDVHIRVYPDDLGSVN